jgi:hypothetical protein
MKHRVKMDRRKVNDWHQEIKKVWDELSLDYIKSLIGALPVLVVKVIVAKGDRKMIKKKLRNFSLLTYISVN